MTKFKIVEMEEEIESIITERNLDFAEGFVHGLFYTKQITAIQLTNLNEFAISRNKQAIK